MIIENRIPKELSNYIKESEINDFLNRIPDLDTLNCYIFDLHLSKAIHHTFPFNFKIVNVGNKKAENIYLDFTFPDNCLIMNNSQWNKVKDYYNDNIDIIDNPLEIARNRRRGYRNTIYRTSTNKYKYRSQEVLDQYSKISIHLDELLHTRCFQNNTRYHIIPFSIGISSLTVSVLCEDYEDNEILEYPMEFIN